VRFLDSFADPFADEADRPEHDGQPASQVARDGVRLRDAHSPTGSETRMPAAELTMAISIDSTRFWANASRRSKFSGIMRPRNFALLSRPIWKRAEVKSSVGQA
jgi:hypothetical protein